PVGIASSNIEQPITSATKHNGWDWIRFWFEIGVRDPIIFTFIRYDARLTPQSFQDFECVFKFGHPPSSRRKGIIVRVVLVLFPACANTHDEAPARQKLQGCRHFCQESRVTVTLAQHHRADFESRPAGGYIG